MTGPHFLRIILFTFFFGNLRNTRGETAVLASILGELNIDFMMTSLQVDICNQVERETIFPKEINYIVYYKGNKKTHKTPDFTMCSRAGQMTFFTVLPLLEANLH